MSSKIVINFDGFKNEFLKTAIIRLSYLYPKIQFSIVNNSIQLEGIIENEESIKKEVNYIVYREKIYAESLEIRKKIFDKI